MTGPCFKLVRFDIFYMILSQNVQKTSNLSNLKNGPANTILYNMKKLVLFVFCTILQSRLAVGSVKNFPTKFCEQWTSDGSE